MSFAGGVGWGGGEENQGPGGRVGVGKRTRGGGGGGGGEKRSPTGEEIAGGEEGVGTVDGGRRRRRRGSNLQQMGWLLSTILPFIAPFIAISSYL